MWVQDLPFITKVVRPRPPSDAVERPRVVEALRSVLEKRVVVVWAPAGYGKTTSLIELAAQTDFPVCWYTLTSHDREPALFVRYCRRAVESVVGPLGGPEAVLDVPRLSWEMALGQLITILSRFPSRLLLVFDDLHQLDGYDETLEALSMFIERAPENLRFALVSRTRPSLRCLPRLAVQGGVSTVGVETLQFLPDETARLLSLTWKRPVESSEARLVNERASGWAAAIALIARTGGGVEAGQAVQAASAALLFEYLSEEVLRKLPEEDQVFLLRTSILREFTAELSDMLLGQTDSAERLIRLKAAGCMIEERPGTSPIHRYHDLFREHTEHAFKARNPELYAELNRRAAALAENRGDYGAAVEHHLSAGVPHDAALVLKRAAESYLHKGRWQTLQSWLSLLPVKLVDGDAELLLLRATLYLRLGKTTEAADTLDRLITTLGAGKGSLLGKALVTRSFAKRLLGNLAAAVENAEEGVAVLRLSNAPAAELSEAYRQLASAHGTRGELAKAKYNLEMARALAPDGDLHLRSLIHDGLAAMHLQLGKLDSATVNLEHAREGWLKLKSDGALAETLNNLAVAYYWRGEFDIALDELREAERAAVSAAYQRLVATVHMTQGIVLRGQRRYQEALGKFLVGLDEARRLLDQRLVAEAVNGLGNTYRRLDQLDKAELLLGQALLQAQESDQQYLAARYQVALGKVYCQSGAFDKALHYLETAENWFGAQENLRDLAEAKLHKAWTLYRTGETERALAGIAQVGDLIAHLGYDGFLVADADEALELIRLSVAKGIRSLGLLLQRLEGRDEDRGARRSGKPGPLPTLRVFGFGNGRVFLEGHLVSDREWRSRKAKELFFYLLYRQAPASKEQLIEALWGEGPLDKYDDALRMNVYRLRRALFPACLLTVGEGYSLNSEIPLEFDCHRFEALVQEAERLEKGSSERAKLLGEALALYGGTFLEEFYSEWCESARRELERKYRRAIMSLASYFAEKGEFARAVEMVEKAVAVDPYDEPAHLLLAKGLLQLGDPLSALRCLHDFATRLRDELQMQPSAVFVALYEQALKQGPFAGSSIAR
ncbi:MAG: tetratricopeptide repeat protein [Chloroflexota bacterium]|nr:tetratricopeptide repeat protein [Chloroflexota bacterium]